MVHRYRNLLQTTIRIERGCVLLSHFLAWGKCIRREKRRNEKLRLRLRYFSVVVSTECKIVEHDEGSFRGFVRHAQQSETDLSRKLLCLGHLNANLVTLHSLVYNRGKRGWTFHWNSLPRSWKGTAHPLFSEDLYVLRFTLVWKCTVYSKRIFWNPYRIKGRSLSTCSSTTLL